MFTGDHCRKRNVALLHQCTMVMQCVACMHVQQTFSHTRMLTELPQSEQALEKQGVAR
jgi:hypothetical protein